MLQRIHFSKEIRAQEFSQSDAESRYGTLLHVCAAHGRTEIAMRLLTSFGADPSDLK
jgi:hypothetical protein